MPLICCYVYYLCFTLLSTLRASPGFPKVVYMDILNALPVWNKKNKNDKQKTTIENHTASIFRRSFSSSTRSLHRPTSSPCINPDRRIPEEELFLQNRSREANKWMQIMPLYAGIHLLESNARFFYLNSRCLTCQPSENVPTNEGTNWSAATPGMYCRIS